MEVALHDGGLGPLSSSVTVRLVADHIDHDGALHGGGRSLIRLTEALRDQGVDAEALVLHEPSELGWKLVLEKAPLQFLSRSPYDPRTALDLVRICRQEGVDVLHLTDFAACTWGRLAGRRSGAATVVHVRSHHSPHQPRGFPRSVELAYRTLAPMTDAAVANSESVRDFAVARMGFEPHQVTVLHNPLPPGAFEPPDERAVDAVRERHCIPRGASIVGTVTRFHAAKGNRYLVEAFAAVAASHPNAWLVIVGEGPEELELRDQARELGVEDRVVFAGYRSDVKAYYRAFDVSTVPSIEEGFGNVAVEAMAMGTPVVASGIGGLQEIIADGENGLLVPSADSGALAAVLTDLLGDPERLNELGRAGRTRSKDFEMASYLQRLMRVYERARGPRTPR